MLKCTTLILCMCLIGGTASAQIEMSLFPQPPDIFKTVFGSSGNGYILWQADICNLSAETTTVHAGKIYIAAHKNDIPTISPLLISSVIRRAESRNWIRIFVRAAKWGSLTAAILSGTDAVNLSDTVRGILPLSVQTFDSVGRELETDLPDTAVIQRSFLDGLMELSGGACAYKLLMSKDDGVREALVMTIN